MEQPQQGQVGERAGDVRRAISRTVVALLKEHFGRGPIRAKAYLHDDWVLVLMYNGHTAVEHTLGAHGEQQSVASQRVKASEAIREQLVAVVESETGRKVIGFMSSSQQDPSLLSLVFVLESSDLLRADDSAGS
jgi:uncharacterized protein YbcI